MKLRTGFVSNSSSSSFVVCGFSLPNSMERKVWQQLILENVFNVDINKEKLKKQTNKTYYDEECFLDGLLYDILKDNDFVALSGSDDGVDDQTIFGKLISETSADEPDLSYKEISLSKIEESLYDAHIKLEKELGEGEIGPIMVYTGTRMC